MSIRYSLDVDGVVADYFKSRGQVARKLGIRPLSQPLGMQPEDLDVFMQERMAEINRVVGNYIGEHLEEFLGGLECTVTLADRQAIGRAAAGGWELFFITSRSFFGGHNYGTPEQVKPITEEWLTRNGLPADPAHVILTSNKAQVISTNHIRYHLDDAVAHVTSIALQSPARVYLLRRPWNQHFLVKVPDEPDADYYTTAGAYGVEEVDSIAEYILQITGA